MLENKNLIKYIDRHFSKNESTLIQEKISIYKDMLVDENNRINLISKTTIDDIENRHLLDSIQLISLFNDKSKSLVDIGSGAGLPGIFLRPEGLIQPISTKWSIDPLPIWTPLIFSISDLVTGWWYAIIDRVSVAALDKGLEITFSIFKYSEISEEVINA